MKHALIAALILLVGLVVGSLGDHLWDFRARQAEAVRMEQRRETEPLLRFGSSLAQVSLDAPRTHRASVYVPAYASVRVATGRTAVQLATTLSMHNTSREKPLILERIDYHGTDGQLVQAHLDRPVALKPFGVLEVFVSAEDKRGGAGANFLVEWAADGPISEPVIETVMAGTSYSSTSYSFVSQGRPLRTAPPHVGTEVR